jgi:GNAT superfamily N-acetyltransferase
VKPRFELRPYRPGDERHIFELFQLCFGRDLSEQLWQWRYLDDPVGPGVICLAWDGDTLVAHHAVSCVGLHVQGQDWVMGLGGAAMTHPSYRGYGLYRQLAQWTWDRMAERGMPVAVAFANAFSHRLIIRDLAFVDLCQIPTFRLSLPPASGFSERDKQIVELEDFDDRFDQLWKCVSDDYAVIARRSRAHLHWRYVRRPAQRYRILAYLDGGELLGYVVLKRYREELHLVDVLSVRDVEVAERLILCAAQLAVHESASGLSLWLNVSHPLHWALERLGFCNGEPVTYMTAKVLRPELSEAAIYDFRNWYVTMGDSDVY